MKIDVTQLAENLTIEISGNEEWLSKIYSSFPHPKNESKPLITGKVLVRVDNPTYIQISGSVDYSPFLECDRCSTPIRWPMSEAIDVILLREKPQFEEEADLEEDELNEYFMEDGRHFDLEIAINDSLQTARPSRVILEEGHTECVSSSEMEDQPFASSKNSDASNPFAALKDMQLNS